MIWKPLWAYRTDQGIRMVWAGRGRRGGAGEGEREPAAEGRKRSFGRRIATRVAPTKTVASRDTPDRDLRRSHENRRVAGHTGSRLASLPRKPSRRGTRRIATRVAPTKTVASRDTPDRDSRRSHENRRVAGHAGSRLASLPRKPSRRGTRRIATCVAPTRTAAPREVVVGATQVAIPALALRSPRGAHRASITPGRASCTSSQLCPGPLRSMTRKSHTPSSASSGWCHTPVA